jgi:hypothetical protein
MTHSAITPAASTRLLTAARWGGADGLTTALTRLGIGWDVDYPLGRRSLDPTIIIYPHGVDWGLRVSNPRAACLDTWWRIVDLDGRPIPATL